MTWNELIWLPPVMLAIALVLGTAGHRGVKETARSITNTFFALTVGVIVVGVVIHIVARTFA